MAMSIVRSVFAPQAPPGVLRDQKGNTYVPSSFGIDNTTFGPGFNPSKLCDGARVQQLEFREKFYRCQNHDGKVFDFDGRLKPPGPIYSQPMLSSAASTREFYVPLSDRRPSSPYRLGRLIVSRFTSLIFEEGRWPAIQCAGDPRTEDFIEALIKAQRMEAKMVMARNIGGSVGTVGLSWRFWDGLPRLAVHNGKHLHVHTWVDREELIPEHVSELYQYEQDEWNPDKRRIDTVAYWHRRDWTPMADLHFMPVRVTKDQNNVDWVVDAEKTTIHGDDFCHFVWVQNLPPDDSSEIDGQPDYEGIYENFGSLDILNSVTFKGAGLNLDPTLLLKVDPELVKRGGVKKGSDNAIAVGESGDASYMELAGTSVDAGGKMIVRERGQMLEITECVVPDPNTISAAGTSSLGVKLMFAPMTNKGGKYRTQYGQAIERVLAQQVKSARRRMLNPDGSPRIDIEVDPETGAEQRVMAVLRLPPRVELQEERDPQGNLTGSTSAVMIDRTPGTGGDIELKWGPWFEETIQEKQLFVQTMSAAAGGKPVISHRSAVETTAEKFGLDPAEEWKQVSEQVQADAKAQAGMFPSFGGEVPGYEHLPGYPQEPITTPAEGASPASPESPATPTSPAKPALPSASATP